MPGDGYTLDALTAYTGDAFKKNIRTLNEQKEYILSRLPKVTDTPDQIRTFFEKMLPGQNVTQFSSDEMRERRLNHANAYSTWVHFAAEYGCIEQNPGPNNELRFMGAVYKPERTQEDIDYNKTLRDAIASGDFAKVGRIYDEHIKNLPSFDPEMIQNLPDKDLPQAFRDLYPLSIAIQEGHKFLEDSSATARAMRDAMSEESKARLAELVKHMDTFASLKIRCDNMFSPYYPFIDTSKLACTDENIEALAADVPEGTSDLLSKYAATLSGELAYTANGFGEDTGRLLEAAGMDPKQTKVRDPYGKEYALSDWRGDCSEVLKRGEPVFCTSGNQKIAFKMEGRKVVQVDEVEAFVHVNEKILPEAMETAEYVLNSRIANPRWMFTGSAEYRGMQKAYAQYNEAVGGKPSYADRDDPKATKALEELGESARAYFERKGVNLEEFHDYKSFWANCDLAKNMKDHELARMEGAYHLLGIYEKVKGAQEMQKELYGMPVIAVRNIDKKGYTEKLQEKNAAIRDSKFLNDTVEAVKGNDAGERLREDIKNALTAQGKGLLDKTFFSPQDRQAAEDVLAKAVILSMIRTGREITQSSPVQIENNYLEKPAETIDMIKGSTAFKNAVGNNMTPDTLRNFLAENRQVAVNKSISNEAVQQHKDAQAATMQQNQPHLQLNIVQNAPQQMQPQAPEQVAKPQGLGMGGVPG